MNQGISISEMGADKITRQEQKAELASYLVGQTPARQALHKWMKVLKWAGLALIVAWFALALYLSINHTAVPATMIAVAWFLFPVSAVPLMILEGLHTIGLRASVPSVLPSKPRKLVTGAKAVGTGWGQILIALAVGAFWGGFAWAVWSLDMRLIDAYVRVLGTVLGIVIPVAIVLGLISALYRQLVRSR